MHPEIVSGTAGQCPKCGMRLVLKEESSPMSRLNLDIGDDHGLGKITMIFSGIGVANKLLKREPFQCVCIGTFLKVPLTKITLIEDFGMAILALIMLLMHGANGADINPLIFQFHSPEEFREIVTLGHWIIGYLLGTVAVIALIQALGVLKKKTYLWPVIIIVASVIIVPFTFLHHELNQLRLVAKVMWLDMQQRQHIIMIFFLFIAGVSEFLYATKKLKNELWGFVWPSVLIIIGLMFVLHPQHGNAEALAFSELFHEILGIVLILSGIFKGLEITSISESKQKIFSFAWIIFLLVAAMLFISYIEPVGSYQLL